MIDKSFCKLIYTFLTENYVSIKVLLSRNFFHFSLNDAFFVTLRKNQTMYQFLLEAHSGLRYVVMLLLIIAIILSLAGWFGNKAFTAGNKRVNLFTLISTHIQLVLGLILYFVSPYVKAGEMGTAMKDATLRYWTVEHIVMMLIAVTLITVGYSKSKKLLNDVAKHKTVAIFYGLAFIIIIVAIVLSGRPVIGK